MAAVLGVSAHYHDAAAALVVDGRVVAAISEERLSRIKHDASIPLRAAAACLKIAGLAAADLDAVVYYEQPFKKLERIVSSMWRTFPRSARQFPRAMAAQLGSKLWIVDNLAEGIGVARANVATVDHHHSHAASAFFVSPDRKSVV